jgi:hypothetical protein
MNVNNEGIRLDKRKHLISVVHINLIFRGLSAWQRHGNLLNKCS